MSRIAFAWLVPVVVLLPHAVHAAPPLACGSDTPLLRVVFGDPVTLAVRANQSLRFAPTSAVPGAPAPFDVAAGRWAIVPYVEGNSWLVEEVSTANKCELDFKQYAPVRDEPKIIGVRDAVVASAVLES